MNEPNMTASWLTGSIKNRYFFNTPRSALEMSTYHSEWKAVVRELFAALKEPMTRDEYLSWRSAWRATYSKLSDESRFSKNYRRYSPTAHYQVDEQTATQNIKIVEDLRVLANDLMDMRTQSFIIANNSYKMNVKVLEVA